MLLFCILSKIIATQQIKTLFMLMGQEISRKHSTTTRIKFRLTGSPQRMRQELTTLTMLPVALCFYCNSALVPTEYLPSE